MRVVVGGPPHAGKSVFTAALYLSIKDRLPDGIGDDFFSVMTLDLSDNTLRWLLYDGEPRKFEDSVWTEENARDRAEEFSAADGELVLADAPGEVDNLTRTLLGPADALLIMYSTEHRDKLDEWTELADELGLEIIAILQSIHPDNEEEDSTWDPQTERGKFKGAHREDAKIHQRRALPQGSQSVVNRIALSILERVL